jgi:hypothetical protein
MNSEVRQYRGQETFRLQTPHSSPMATYINDGSTDEPKLRLYLNLDTLAELRPDTIWPGLTGAERLRRLAADGFEGVQQTEDTAPPEGSPLPCCGCARINAPGEADPIAAKHAGRGHTCLTVHAGWGLEDDADAYRLIEAILAASDRHELPIFIETHRATIAQDLWRTVQLTRQFPEIRFNGDFSHYYTGQEMVYGGMQMKLAFMEPIFARVGFIHGRIGSPGNMQVPVDAGLARPRQAHGDANYLEHFLELWTRAMLGFLRSAGRGDYLIFAPELLSGRHYYARLFPDARGQLVEETDRYQQALLYQELARSCFTEAQGRLRAEPGVSRSRTSVVEQGGRPR